MNEDKILDLVRQANPDNPISFVHDIVKPLAQEKLDNYILSCNDCDIANCAKRSISYGNPNASIMIIGESLSTEQFNGPKNTYSPFEDDSVGEILNTVLDKLNVNRDEIFYINSVNCYPYRTQGENTIKRSPTKNERTNCSSFLDYAIKIVEPLMIICLGGVAINGINEEIGRQSVTNIRGQMFMYRGVSVMPTFHPGYFIEIEGKVDEDMINLYKWDFYNDLESAFNYAQANYPDLKIIKGE